jgi:hypothetical protein
LHDVKRVTLHVDDSGLRMIFQNGVHVKRSPGRFVSPDPSRRAVSTNKHLHERGKQKGPISGCVPDAPLNLVARCERAFPVSLHHLLRTIPEHLLRRLSLVPLAMKISVQPGIQLLLIQEEAFLILVQDEIQEGRAASRTPYDENGRLHATARSI